MAIDAGYIVIIKSHGIGDAEPDLGETLMKSFLKVIVESDRLPAKIFFLAGGVFLTTEGSPIADQIKALESRGVELLSCTTCLEYYGRRSLLIAGKPTTMKETVEAQLAASKVVYA